MFCFSIYEQLVNGSVVVLLPVVVGSGLWCFVLIFLIHS